MLGAACSTCWLGAASSEIGLPPVGFPKTLPCLRCGQLIVTDSPAWRMCRSCRKTIAELDVGAVHFLR